MGSRIFRYCGDNRRYLFHLGWRYFASTDDENPIVNYIERRRVSDAVVGAAVPLEASAQARLWWGVYAPRIGHG